MKFMYVYAYLASMPAFMVPAISSQAPVLEMLCLSVFMALLAVFE